MVTRQVVEKDQMLEENDYFDYIEESTSESDVNLENQYYHAKTVKEENLEASLLAFQSVLDQQDESTEGIWSFKALKQMVKINFELKNYEEAIKTYKKLLICINPAITTNQAAKSINSILDYISTSGDMELLQDFYQATLALKNSKNDRLWFRINFKLGKIFLQKEDFETLVPIIEQLKEACSCYDPESDDVFKGTKLIEIYALEMEMYVKLNNYEQLKKLYERALEVKSVIPDTISMSVIRECGGKIYLQSGNFKKAYDEFFAAFMNYDNWKSVRRFNCLKYLLISSMVNKSAGNPFYFEQIKPYENNPEIKTLTDLIAVYHNQNLRQFENILQKREESSSDPLMEELIDLLPYFRTQKLLLLVKRFNSVGIWFIAEELGLTEDETKNLIASSIQHKKLCGIIDLENNLLILDHTDVNL